MRASFFAYVLALFLCNVSTAATPKYRCDFNYGKGGYVFTHYMYLTIFYDEIDQTETQVKNFVNDYIKPNLTSKNIVIIGEEILDNAIEYRLYVKNKELIPNSLGWMNKETYLNAENKVKEIFNIAALTRALNNIKIRIENAINLEQSELQSLTRQLEIVGLTATTH